MIARVWSLLRSFGDILLNQVAAVLGIVDGVAGRGGYPGDGMKTFTYEDQRSRSVRR